VVISGRAARSAAAEENTFATGCWAPVSSSRTVGQTSFSVHGGPAVRSRSTARKPLRSARCVVARLPRSAAARQAGGSAAADAANGGGTLEALMALMSRCSAASG
jgi:hypothetical protein